MLTRPLSYLVSRVFSRSHARTRGQGIIEYALILALVTLVIIGTLVIFGKQIVSEFQNIENNL
jgi:pilus assembly protein Flp/PilA